MLMMTYLSMLPRKLQMTCPDQELESSSLMILQPSSSSEYVASPPPVPLSAGGCSG